MGFVLSIKVFVYLFICILFRKMLKAVILYHTTLLHYTMLYYTILLQWLHFIQIFTKFDSPIVLFFFFFFSFACFLLLLSGVVLILINTLIWFLKFALLLSCLSPTKVVLLFCFILSFDFLFDFITYYIWGFPFLFSGNALLFRSCFFPFQFLSFYPYFLLLLLFGLYFSTGYSF